MNLTEKQKEKLSHAIREAYKIKKTIEDENAALGVMIRDAAKDLAMDERVVRTAVMHWPRREY